MLKRTFFAAVLSIGTCSIGSYVQAATVCPGQNSSSTPTNLACELPAATGAGLNNLGPINIVGPINTAIATQLGQLPFATAVSGSGLTVNKKLGVLTATEDSLGTILTQRGETLGKGKFMLSFTYQHFGFGEIDGIRLKAFPTIVGRDVSSNGQTVTSNAVAVSHVDFAIDEYSALAVVGLTNRVDLAVLLPFSNVNLNTLATGDIVLTSNGATSPLYTSKTGTPVRGAYFAGSKAGVGDLTLNLKVSVCKGEKTSFAAGSEFRLNTGDATNFLGSGATGVKPYIVISRRSRFTPNLSVAYQWNSSSILNLKPNGHGDNLPASFLYSGGVDFRVNRRLTLVGEFTGQLVLDGQTLARQNTTATTFQGVPAGTPYVKPFTETYAMDNLGGGIKVNPFKNFFVDASVMFKLDDSGLRSKIIPLAGASYRF